uniref:Uncharacterized protein n=2 Tax=Oryza sativa subsp. japonica TaxID=39947 RepID=Q10IL2_ORYSJ|nr:hypothetical protein [Oryza sativa Japonica Group]ABF96977.1 hypothetical protein LOC_Os03g33864 [Oryza sativa Japonica Group]
MAKSINHEDEENSQRRQTQPTVMMMAVELGVIAVADSSLGGK